MKMNNINDLIVDDIIDKEKLILKRGHLLNLDENQSRFLSKVFSKKNSNYKNLDMVEISKIFSVDLKTAETIMKELLTNNLVSISYLENKMIFDFDLLINKLLKTYTTPLPNDDLNSKRLWIISHLKFELSEQNLFDLKKIIIDEDWDKISIVINKMRETEKHNWPLFVSLLNNIVFESSKENNEIKRLLDQNWLK